MELLIPSFIAGILTVLAPCVLALLPIILGGSVAEKNPWRPLIVSLSLAVSVIVFTLLLKGTSALLGVPEIFWKVTSGILVLSFGILMLFPDLWEKIAFKLKLYKSEENLHKNSRKQGWQGAVLLGASLGPVFTTCSPTYTLIIAIVLPQNFFNGFINLLAYSLGLFLIMLLIGYGGQKITKKLRSASNPRGWFKRSLGILLILTGLAVITGYDKKIESEILKSGYLGPIEIEQNLLDKFQE